MRLFITRGTSAEDAGDDPISLSEWKELVQDIPQLHFYEGVEALPAHVAAPTASEGLARWTAHPRFKSVWFNHSDGRIYTEGYDAYVTTRMRSLANRLGATVIDDQGRTY